MDKSFPPDHFVTGMVIAAISITLCYIVLTQFAVWWEQALGNAPILKPPSPQLIILVIHIITFRQLMIAANRYATGAGFFIVLFGATLYYLYSHSNEIFHG
jgi:hypothetical protein